jgi:hypothetical protein
LKRFRVASKVLFGLSVMAFSAVSTAVAQEAQPAPVAGPSLAVTLQFVTDKINEIGPITKPWGQETIHSATANADACTLSWKLQYVDPDSPQNSNDKPDIAHFDGVSSFQVVPQKGWFQLRSETRTPKGIISALPFVTMIWHSVSARR